VSRHWPPLIDDGTTPEPGTGSALRPTAPLQRSSARRLDDWLGWGAVVLLLIGLALILTGCTQTRSEAQADTQAQEQQTTKTTERWTGTVMGMPSGTGVPPVSSALPNMGGTPMPPVQAVDLTRTVTTTQETVRDEQRQEQARSQTGLDAQAVGQAVGQAVQTAMTAAVPQLAAMLKPQDSGSWDWLGQAGAALGLGGAGAAGLAIRTATKAKTALRLTAALADDLETTNTDEEVIQAKKRHANLQEVAGVRDLIQKARRKT
jgi:hypothetical protein